MVWHHKMCPYAHYPHKNVLPKMPNRNKSSSHNGCSSSDNKEDVTSAGDDDTTEHADTDNSDKCDGETTADIQVSGHI